MDKPSRPWISKYIIEKQQVERPRWEHLWFVLMKECGAHSTHAVELYHKQNIVWFEVFGSWVEDQVRNFENCTEIIAIYDYWSYDWELQLKENRIELSKLNRTALHCF